MSMSQIAEQTANEATSFFDSSFCVIHDELIALAKIPGIAWFEFDAIDFER
ncbi:MAG: hypothetical protein RL723_205, partial [Actinomycetota bacterium]